MGVGPGVERLPTGHDAASATGPASWSCGRRRRSDAPAPSGGGPPGGSAGSGVEVVPVPGKGLGTRALRPIAPGEVLLEEGPLLRVLLQAESEAEYTRCIRAAAEALPAGDLEELLDLACVTLERTPEGVFQGNHFEVDGARVVYRRISRLNHSCRPNCAHSFDRQRGVGIIRALRALEVGEELSLTYTELRAPRVARQQYLLQVYGFVCACEACSPCDARSDQRRELLHSCCEALVPRGPVVQMYNLAGHDAELEGAFLKGKALAEALEARALGLRLAALALRLLAEEELEGAGDAAGHACECATFLLAGHPEAQMLWADECLRFMSLGGSPTDAANMRRGLDNIRRLPPLLPGLPPETAPEVLDPGKIARHGIEAQTLDEARASLQRLHELFDCSVAANAPG